MNENIGLKNGIKVSNKLYKRAKKVIASIDNELSPITWKCRDCNEENDQTFDFCWKCSRENIQ